jgi:hypothetical protein
MAETEPLTVEQVFQLQGIGLTVVPDFSVPNAGWKNGAHRVRVVKPNGEQLEATRTSMCGISSFAIHLHPSTNAGVWLSRFLL